MKPSSLLSLFTTILPAYARLGDLSPRSNITTGLSNHTANTTNLKTWWHTAAEINPHRAVADTNVRQSHLYSVQVSTAGHSKYYDSFVYESIPRSGKGQLCRPNDTAICPEGDGITIEETINATMAWSQFLYGADAVVKITRRDAKPISADKIIIRPTNLSLKANVTGNSALIRVPYSPDTHGLRFSVEFADDIWEYRAFGQGDNAHHVQNVDPSGDYYVPSYNESMPVVGREPLNALLIFASPFPSSDLVPTKNDDTYQVQEGLVTGLDKISQSVVVFNPGVYYFTGKAHAILSPSVSWVYIAPGAYVKGAVQYMNNNTALKATGFGVLSGEQYVYQANPATGYNNSKSDATSLKMWRGEGVTAGQSWTINGITTNAQPFNVMDFYGDLEHFSVDISDYKQVGAFFTQSDGLQMYPHSHVRDVFYHSGDDTIKTYYSDIHAERIVVWKTNNAPIIQMGWYPRNISNITVDHTDVIHTRYTGRSAYAPRALLGYSASYENPLANNTANTTHTISDYTVSNIRAEGISPALVGLNLISNIEKLHISNAWIEQFPNITDVGHSVVRGYTDKNKNNKKVTVGQNSPDGIGLAIKGFTVGDEAISFDAGNWNVTSTGGLDVDSDFGGHWTVS